MKLQLNATISSMSELKELLSQVAALETKDVELQVNYLPSSKSGAASFEDFKRYLDEYIDLAKS